MSNLFKTNLILIGAPLPADFEGSPQDLFRAIVERLEIQSPVGTNFFVVGSVEPQTNVGPWLKDGKQWWVFDAEAGEYVPADISASQEAVFTVSDTEPDVPGDEDARIWLRTSSGRVIAWYFWTGSEWRPGGNRPPSGPTANRPSGPQDLEQYFDTDINTLLHYERGAWRTVSGVPGDIKFVTTSTLVAALAANPGWEYLGNVNQSYIGRVLGIASKDPGATPESSFATDSGITARATADLVGEETHIIESDEIEQHTHLLGSLTALNSDNNIRFYREDNGETIEAPNPRPPNYAEILGDNANNATKNGELPDPSTGTVVLTSTQLDASVGLPYTGPAQPHNNVQPTVFFWALTKL